MYCTLLNLTDAKTEGNLSFYFYNYSTFNEKQKKQRQIVAYSNKNPDEWGRFP